MSEMAQIRFRQVHQLIQTSQISMPLKRKAARVSAQNGKMGGEDGATKMPRTDRNKMVSGKEKEVSPVC